jgi:hypothetical protein
VLLNPPIRGTPRVSKHLLLGCLTLFVAACAGAGVAALSLLKSVAKAAFPLYAGQVSTARIRTGWLLGSGVALQFKIMIDAGYPAFGVSLNDAYIHIACSFSYGIVFNIRRERMTAGINPGQQRYPPSSRYEQREC